MQVQELQSQLKMYESVKSDYLEKNATKDEQQEYQELMDKLTLLTEEAKSERERLAMEALENEKKAKALNKYQQMVRNIVNANKVAKTKLITRNEIIEEQDTTIDVQKQNISTLEAEIDQKRDLIEQGERKIQETKAALERKQKALLAAFKNNEITKQAYEERTRALQEQNDKKIKDLQSVNQTYASQVDQLASALKGTQSALDQKTVEAQKLQTNLAKATGEAEGLKSQLGGLQDQMNGLRNQHSQELAGMRAALDAEIKKGQMDAAERARREGEFKAAAARKEKELAGKLAGLQGQVAGLQGQLKDTEGALSKAKAEMDARREIAREIQKGFAAAGVKADIDMLTGEVVLDFGESYFDSDSANLKDEMKDVIERAMPVYSKSLFGNPKVADKISAVEVVGFASPTYKGRFVDPNSNKAEDKAALKYNMDLSYRRANAIFTYLLDDKGPQSDHQKNLLSRMKVSGRSFLELMKVKNRGPASAAEFCKQNDCKKAQRVIVRFSMDGKK